MNINQIILTVMAIFAVVGGLDYIFGKKLGLGEHFEGGIQALGTLMLSMAGLLILTPPLAKILGPVVSPVFNSLGADPAMFAGIFFGIDMGAAPLAYEMAADPQAAGLGGMITSAMLGATIVFTIPVGLGIVKPADRPYLAKGILIGMITIPLGVVVGGLAAGYGIHMVLINTLPIAVFSLLIVFGMWKFEGVMIKGFVWFGRFIIAVSIIGLLIGLLEYLIGWKLLQDTMPMTEVFEIVGNIGLMLAGAFPLVHLITKLLRKPLIAFGNRLGFNEESSSGLLVSLANCIPMMTMISEMDDRGKTINFAFAVAGGYMFGDHLGFVAGYQPDLMIPMIVGKFAAGITAVILACFVTRNRKNQDMVS